MPGHPFSTATAPRIASIATAVPPHVLDTPMVVMEAAKIFGRFGEDYARMSGVFSNAGIDRRYSVCPTPWFHSTSNWQDKSRRFLEGATALFREVAAKALAAAGLEANEIDTIVTVSSTGIATPSIEAHVMHDMGFRVDAMRVPVFGLGCAGGISGLALAAQLAHGGRKVLLVVIELCSLAFRPNEMSKSNIVASALFGDGAAALVIAADGKGPAIEHMGQHCWPGTIDIMGWRIDDEGLGAIFSRSIPDLVRKDLRPAVEGFLSGVELQLKDIQNYSFHPGGAKVIQALEATFELPEYSLRDEREILAGFGNMSAPTVLFVLQQALARREKGRRLLGSLGPGFTGSFMTLIET